MTKTITDYQVLFSGSKTITPPPLGGEGGGVGSAFDIPTDFVFGLSKARLILDIEVQAFEEGRIGIEFDNIEARNFKVARSHTRIMREIFTPSQLGIFDNDLGNDTLIHAKVYDGTMRIDSVVIWYQRHV
jgi:hypothetical protein